MTDPTIFIGSSRNLEKNNNKVNIKNQFTYINSREEAALVKEGELIKRWDYVMEIKKSYLYPNQLASLRKIGDVLADKVCDVLSIGVGVDGLTKVLERVELIKSKRSSASTISTSTALLYNAELDSEFEEDEHVLNFYNDIFKEYGNKQTEEYLQFHRQEGRDVFWKYSTEIFGSLLHFSLAG